MEKSIKLVAYKLKIKESQVNTVLEFLKEGSTVPFIARYRQAATEGLNEEVIEQINKEYVYSEELEKRKEAIIKLLEEKSLLTEEIKKAILASETKNALEAIYEPFKNGKKTKASEAIALGLEPLAKSIFTSTDPNFNPIREASKFTSDKLETTDEVIEQVRYIIAQWISQDIKAREYVKHQVLEYGMVVTSIKKNAVDEKQVFKQYYDFTERLNKIANHKVLAISRAEENKIVSKKLTYSLPKIKFDLNNVFFKIKTTGKIISDSLDEALERLLLPSVEREVWSDLFAKAEKGAIELFANNLEEMLLMPAIKGKIVLAIDPAFASGCKVAVLDATSKLLEIALIKPTAPYNDFNGSERIILSLLKKHTVNIIVIGNGTASRETEAFVAAVIKNNGLNIPFAIVSEVGASVYSASKIAIKEFPELSVEQRSAIHIGRKFQDALNELVKIDPKSIGIGQYQHDLDQKMLSEALDFKVSKVVNTVGVDLNTASSEILTHISGLSEKLANEIVKHRNDNGTYKDRKSLKEVKGLGPKAFEQSIGFLRIFDSTNPLDKTAIHPESYKLALQVIKELNLELNSIDVEKIKAADATKVAEKLGSNKYDIQLILDSLLNQNKDIRDSNDGPLLKTDVLSMENLVVGMQLEGTIQNITDFGAFVYIGLKQAALIHLSQLSSKYIKHPSEAVKTNQKVLVEILSIDKERGRIGAKLITSKA